jgi:prophage DNA circulation protein
MWKDKLLIGSFRGVSFATESVDGEIGRRVVLHEYPLRDEPYVEDLGRKARTFALELFVLGPDYMHQRDDLITAFETPGPGVLVHPYRGQITVSVLEVRGPRESTREGGMARFSVVFVESGAALVPHAATDTGQNVKEKADAAAFTLQREFAATFNATSLPEFIFEHNKSLVIKVADKLETLRRSLPGVPAIVTAFVADLQQLTTNLETVIRTPADLAAELYGLVADLALLPDRPTRAIAAYRQLFTVLSGEPVIPRTTANRVRQATNQQALSALVHRAAIVEASRAAATVEVDSYDEASTLRLELSDQLDIEMETADDNSYRDLADLRVALVRDLTARGADLARVVRFTPLITMPALVLAYRLYGDSSRAADIITRNQIKHPGFIPGGSALEVLTDA